MAVYEKSTAMPVSAQELYEWHMAPGAFQKLIPKGQKIEVVEQPEELGEGEILVMKVYLGPVGVTWEALHRDFVPGRQFVDEQLRGPFRKWVHTHRFEPTDGGSLLVDHVEYEPPLGRLGQVAGGWVVRRMLKEMFEERHRITLEDLAVGS